MFNSFDFIYIRHIHREKVKVKLVCTGASAVCDKSMKNPSVYSTHRVSYINGNAVASQIVGFSRDNVESTLKHLHLNGTNLFSFYRLLENKNESTFTFPLIRKCCLFCLQLLYKGCTTNGSFNQILIWIIAISKSQ